MNKTPMPSLYHMLVTNPDEEPFDWATEMPDTAHAATIDFYNQIVTFPWKRVGFADILRIAQNIAPEAHERS